MNVELEFICDVCGRPVEDGCGSLYVRFSDLQEKRRAKAEWQDAREPGQAFDIGTLLQMPGPAPWSIHHVSCQPADDADGYHISVETVRTWRDLVRWTAHLMEKNWLPDTNWQSVLGNAANGWDRRIEQLARGDAA